MLQVKLALYLITALSVGLPWLQVQAQAPPCGQQLSPGAVYRGVPALSNDGDQGMEVDCDTTNQGPPPWPACTVGEDNELNSCSYGELYQCVQYVRRFYSLRNDTANRVDTSSWKGKNAIDYLKVAADGSVTTPLTGFTAFPNSGAYPPMPDDIIVFSEGKKGSGHVAIVMAVTGANVYLIEENWSKNGLASPTFDPATNTVGSRMGRTTKVYKVVGWVRENQGVMGNPVPVISSLSPNSLTVGSAPQPLNITGTGFLSTSTVTFNGGPHAITYLSPNQLSIQLSTTDLESTGYFPVIVTNPPPGGGPSNAVNFVVGNPVPSITSLAPSSLPVNSPPQPLTINGTGFVSSSTVSFSGQSRATTFVSGTELTIQLTTTDLAAPGSYPVYVTNPGPYGGTSNIVDFIVSGQSEVTISPTSVTVPEAGLQTFSATVSIGGGVTWSVQEGSTGGTISSTGIYTPPNSTGVFHVVATSIQDPSQYAVATVTVVPALTLTILHSFGAPGFGTDGYFPQAGVVQGNDGGIYGTTYEGGILTCDVFSPPNLVGCGTVFKIDTSGNFVLLHSFAAGDSDGALPLAPLIQATDGNFYGTTEGGGADSSCAVGAQSGCGTIFKEDASGNFALLHSLSQLTDGAFPHAPLVQAHDGNFYGTAYEGGNGLVGGCCGTVFKTDTSGNYTVVHAFENLSDGSLPNSALFQTPAGYFYATTVETIFQMDESGNVTTLYAFQFHDHNGDGPEGGVIQARDSFFYGTTSSDGQYGFGSVFKMDAAGNLTAVHFFGGVDGKTPEADLIQGQDGFLYGNTSGGGSQSAGTIFRMDSAGNVTVLHSFSGRDGSSPLGSLIFGQDGSIYGTASGGGANSGGVVFQLSVTGLNAPARVGRPK